jgi:hypothetical protein
MALRRTVAVTVAFMALSLPLSACHVHGHVPPGKVKHVVAPPPGHTATPPGQEKKN